MPDMEKVIKGLERCSTIDMCCMEISCYHPMYLECPYHEDGECVKHLVQDALELLKGQDEQKRQWLIEIADNQIAHAPYPNKDEYTRGIYDGLEMAWQIITGGKDFVY